MKRQESIILLSLCLVLVFLNLYNYHRRERIKRDLNAIIEESQVQVSINEAGIDELSSLPGIGPALASRIIEYRKNFGKFQCLEDIKKVKGIGPHIYDKIAAFIKL